MKNQSWYPWAELCFVEQCHQNFRKEVILSAWNDIKWHSASLYCYCCQYGNRGAGQLASFHNWDGSFRSPQSLDLCSLLACWDLRQIMACISPLCLCCSASDACSRSGLLWWQTQPSYKASGKSLKPDLITSWSTAVVSDRVPDEIFPVPRNIDTVENGWWNVD